MLESPITQMKRGGVHCLAPFFKCMCVYFVALGSGGMRTPGIWCATAKSAPIFCLVTCVLLAPTPRRPQYVRWIALGLTLSAIGDVLLVWPDLFIWGMTTFAAAHIVYITAFGFRPTQSSIGAGFYAATATFVYQLKLTGVLKFLVPIYSALLATTAWRGVVRGGPAAYGASMFLMSDALLGYTMFRDELPQQQVLVMMSYYIGQLGIALSAINCEPPPQVQANNMNPLPQAARAMRR